MLKDLTERNPEADYAEFRADNQTVLEQMYEHTNSCKCDRCDGSLYYENIDQQADSEGWAALVEAEQAAYEKRQARLEAMTDAEWQAYLDEQNEAAGSHYDAKGGRW